MYERQYATKQKFRLKLRYDIISGTEELSS